MLKLTLLTTHPVLPRPFPAMLKLTFIATPLYIYDKTDFFDHASILPWLNWFYWPRPFTTMLKRTLMTTTFLINAKTDFIDHAPLQSCWNYLYLPRPYPSMLKLILQTTSISSHAQTIVGSVLYTFLPIHHPNPVATELRTILFLFIYVVSLNKNWIVQRPVATKTRGV
jgi:hypothetical protein